MWLLRRLFTFLDSVVLFPTFKLLRYVFPDLFDDPEPRPPDNADVSRSPLIHPSAFEMPMPADEEMPTPEGPLAPSSTYSRSAASPHEHADQNAAVQHIYDGETQLLAGESPELFPPQPTESESLFGDRSSAGPMCLEDDSDYAFVSETSAGLTRGMPSAHRSIGSDLTNLDQAPPRPPRTAGAGCLTVMRHGERQDMADAAWAATAPRPWDPPLSPFGLKQAAQRGAELAEARVPVHAVVASPFARCIQTAVELMRAYGLRPGALTVDARMCEWMSARNLNLTALRGRADLDVDVRRDATTWFWGGHAEDGLRATVAAAWSAEAAAKVRIGELKFPLVNETQGAARTRFQGAFTAIASEAGGKGGVVIVTHGDAVGAIVEQVLPMSTVYQVETAGFVRLQRQPRDAGGAFDVAFDVAGAVGVQWLQ